MVKRLLEIFSEEEHAALVSAKKNKAKELNLTKLTWHDYILHISGIKDKTEVDRHGKTK